MARTLCIVNYRCGWFGCECTFYVVYMDENFFWFECGDGQTPQSLAARFVKAGHVKVVINHPFVGMVPFGPVISEEYFPQWAKSIEKHFGCRHVSLN